MINLGVFILWVYGYGNNFYFDDFYLLRFFNLKIRFIIFLPQRRNLNEQGLRIHDKMNRNVKDIEDVSRINGTDQSQSSLGVLLAMH